MCYARTWLPDVRDAENDPQHKKIVVWFVWSVWFFWLNETNQMNQINQINKTNQIDQTDRAWLKAARWEMDKKERLCEKRSF